MIKVNDVRLKFSDLGLESKLSLEVYTDCLQGKNVQTCMGYAGDLHKMSTAQ